MDPKIQEIINRLAEFLSAQKSADLPAVLDQFTEEARSAASTRNVESLRALTEACNTIRAEITKRETDQAAVDAEIAQLLSSVEPLAPAAESEEAETEEETEESAEESATEAEGELVPTTSTPESIAASVTSPGPLPTIADLNARRPARSKPQPTPGLRVITAAGDIPGFSAGREMEISDIGKAVFDKWKATKGSRVDGKIPVATIRAEFPESRRIGLGTPEADMRVIQNLVSPQALTASGGICAPAPVRYEFDGVGSDVRPIRDVLPRFDANRGAVQVFRTPGLGAVADALGVHTNADDIAGNSKNVLVVNCPEPTTCTVQAITRILQFGNFMGQYFPELTDEYLRLANVAQARLAENELWDAMCDQSTAITSGSDAALGAIPDFLAALARAGASYRSRHRVSEETVLRAIAPSWLLDLLRVDGARRAPGDATLSLSNAQIRGWLTNYNINLVLSPDGGGQVFGAQGDGALINWPDTVETLLYPEGAFIFGDGGSLDLGIVRDSTLNNTNDFQVFAETMEFVCLVGVESYCLTMDLCPSGKAQALDDVEFCDIGS